ncbi:hypothetical protein P9578_30580 [Brevibacillus choshinensis]|uniref:hypothetical protein n=1 Tax=Brevibacillus choshinensis TaxID=54911 RepID=UPI002E1DD1CE|nr:hypothetical protein [Brevibacillus choshinensis]
MFKIVVAMISANDSPIGINYPFAAEFYAVTAGSANPNVSRFIEWILSEQGQFLVEKTGDTKI